MANASSEMHIRLLIINPNTSEHMTDALKPLVENLGFKEVGPIVPATLSAPVAEN
jgi:Asp/Glu/hydantoin racemase